MEINILLEKYLIFVLVCIILAHSAVYDYKHKIVQWFVPVALISCGILYLLLGYASMVDTFAVIVLIAFIFGLPCLFNFGVGDLLIFIGLGFFLGTEESLFSFLSIFLAIWFIWTVFIIAKYKKEKKFNSWKSILYEEYPLIPVVAFSFYVWMAYTYVLC